MQYTSRMYIKFVDKKDFDEFTKSFKLTNESGEDVALAEFIGKFDFSIFDNGLFVSDSGLDVNMSAFIDDSSWKQLFDVIADGIKEEAYKAAVLSETLSYSGDPFLWMNYCLGEMSHSDFKMNSYAIKHMDIDIKDIGKWIGSGKTSLTKDEKGLLKQLKAK